MGTLLGRWVPWENSFFRETVGTRVWGVGAILTMVDQGYDPSVALKRVKVQGWQPLGVIEGTCGYSTRQVGTLGKLVF